MNGKFTLSIEMGNAEMETEEHLSLTLCVLADHLRLERETGPIFDGNGNTVGYWLFEREGNEQ
jgi:hypothetical protein